jgi:hypothetical protein
MERRAHEFAPQVERGTLLAQLQLSMVDATGTLP